MVAGILGLLGTLFLCSWRTRQSGTTLAPWGSAMLLGAAGMLMHDLATETGWQVLRGVPDALLVGAAGLVWMAARAFDGRAPAPLTAAAGALACLAAPFVFGGESPVPVALSTGYGAAYTAAAAAELWLGGRRERLPTRPLAVLLLKIHAGVFAARAAVALAGDPDLLGAVNWPVLLLSEALLHNVGMALILLAMAKERAERQTVAALAATRDAALAASEAKSRFVAEISHEIRTPLNGVLGLAQALAADAGLAPAHRAQAETIERAGRHLLAIVGDVLDMAKIEAGKLELEEGRVAVPALLREVVSLVAAAAQASVTLRLDLKSSVPEAMMGDATRLRQVLLNLLGNAVKFTPAGGTVTLVACCRPRGRGAVPRLRLEVRDTGPGVPAKARRKLFQEFSQVDGSVARQYGGTGLGLAISAALARAMGGGVGHKPGPFGRGSTFWVELPVRPAPVAEPVAAAPAPVAEPARVPRSLRVLVADDVAANRAVARLLLEGAGHQVVPVSDGAEAVAAVAVATVAEKAFDAVLMDVHMPGMDGFEATRRIRALSGARGRLPILALTADVLPEQIEACQEAGMDGHVSKPIERAALLAALARAVVTARRAPTPALVPVPAPVSMPAAQLDPADLELAAA